MNLWIIGGLSDRHFETNHNLEYGTLKVGGGMEAEREGLGRRERERESKRDRESLSS